MFLGHFAAGLGAKAAAPRTSLGTLVFAAQFVDLIWPTLLLLGLERVAVAPGATSVTPLDFAHYPISHSLAMTVMWGFIVGLSYLAIRRDRRAAIVVGLLVVSHWVLDLLVHRPDLPLYPGDSPMLGLGIWDSLGFTLLIEFSLLAAGLILYMKTTSARDRAGRYGIWVFTALLVLIYAGNVFGPPPPSPTAIAWAGQLQWLLVIGAYWLDRHRTSETHALAGRGTGT